MCRVRVYFRAGVLVCMRSKLFVSRLCAAVSPCDLSWGAWVSGLCSRLPVCVTTVLFAKLAVGSVLFAGMNDIVAPIYYVFAEAEPDNLGAFFSSWFVVVYGPTCGWRWCGGLPDLGKIRSSSVIVFGVPVGFVWCFFACADPSWLVALSVRRHQHKRRWTRSSASPKSCATLATTSRALPDCCGVVCTVYTYVWYMCVCVCEFFIRNVCVHVCVCVCLWLFVLGESLCGCLYRSRLVDLFGVLCRAWYFLSV